MNKILHITNGNSAVNIIREAGIEGDFLPWDDVLHVGPVPAKLSFEALSEVRAEYIITQGWAEADMVDRLFKERLGIMNYIDKYQKITLWFEHDLYDQLQILEILNWFATHPYSAELTMVCTENYLGHCSVAEMKDLVKFEENVSKSQLQLAVKAWNAFRSPTPEKWVALLDEDISVLPFLEGAVLRMLEEYPSSYNGLSRTQNDILEIVAGGEEKLGWIFEEQQKREERIFTGDTVFWDNVNELISATLLTSHEQSVSLTKEGKKVLEGKENLLSIYKPDKWLGGVHLHAANLWCWNDKKKKMEKRQ